MADTGDKRTHILYIAKSLFIQYGYSKTTMADIAKNSGISKAALYYYFKDKAEIFGNVFTSVTDKNYDDLNKALDAAPTFAQKITICFNIWSQQQLTDDGLLNIINLMDDIHEISAIPLVQNVWQRRNKLLHSLIQQGIASGEFKPIDADLMVSVLINSAVGIRLDFFNRARAAAAGSSADYIQRSRFLLQHLLAGIAR